MQYTSPLYFLGFLPLVVIIYQIVPKTKRWIVLLLSSYVFFWSISQYLIVYLLLATAIIYQSALKIAALQRARKEAIKSCEKSEKKMIKAKYQNKQKKILVISIVFLIGLLVVLKYSGFLETNVNTLFKAMHLSIRLPIHRFLVPIGISFYSLQAVSYLVDVYREKIVADEKLGRVALFLAFFPQIMEGPICRYSQTAMALYEGEDLVYQDLKFGLQRIAFGLMKKLLVADRINAIVQPVFHDYIRYDGGVIALAVVCYTCQLYMEFSGTMDIVIGSAEMFHVTMPENFKQPFFSKNISEFWTRWHITLGTWFKDYIFYPLSLSKRLRKITSFSRKHLGHYYGPLVSGSIALACVWFCNGIWHGNAWHYIFFGFYHFILIWLGNVFQPLFHKLPFHKEKNYYRCFQIMRTSILVCFGELFFRARNLHIGFEMLQKIIQDFTFQSFKNGAIFALGLDKLEWLVIIGTVLMVLVVSVLKERGFSIRESLARQNIVVRWSLYYAVVFIIIIFGAYGIGYMPVDPIYAGF